MLRIAKYELQEELGSGGMGTVYRAFDSDLQRVVAIKVLRPSCFSGEQADARFRREAKILATLDHPFLVKIYATDLEASPPYLVEEFVDGQDVHSLVEAGGGGDPETARRILVELAEALAYLHENGIVHRDVKSSNVFLAADGHVRLVDFGLAFDPDRTRLTQTGAFFGTLLWMPPEVLCGQAYVPASDVFQAGLVVHYYLRGALPYLDVTTRSEYVDRAREGTLLADSLAESIPEDLRAGIAACLGMGCPRPRDGADLVRRLAEVRPSERPTATRRTARAPAAGRRPVRRRRSWRLGLLVAAAACVLLVALVAWRRRAAAPSRDPVRRIVQVAPRPVRPAWSDLLAEARAARQEGRREAAAALYARAVARQEEVLGPSGAGRVPALLEMAEVLEPLGRREEARAALAQALAVIELARGKDDPDVARVLTRVGNFAMRRGRFDEAVSAWRRAVAIMEQSLGPAHPETVRMQGEWVRVHGACRLMQRAVPRLDLPSRSRPPAGARTGAADATGG